MKKRGTRTLKRGDLTASRGGAEGTALTCTTPKLGNTVRLCMAKPKKPGHVLTSSESICQVMTFAKDADKESFYALHLDARNRVLAIDEVARGGTSTVHTTPGDIFRGAILSNAVSIVLAHNHPSGDSESSNADRDMTRYLIAAGRVIGIPVRDHVIVASRGCRSLRETGDVEGFDGAPIGMKGGAS